MGALTDHGLNDHGLNDHSGPVDQQLDEMFDRLAGTGAAGRRLLTEAEDHLRAATAEARDRGLSDDDAQREAVARFGRPEEVAVLPSRFPIRVLRVVVGAWVLTGVALVVAGLAGLLGQALAYGFAGLLLATDGLGRVSVADPCAEPGVLQPTISCTFPPSEPLVMFLGPALGLAVAVLCLVLGLLVLSPLVLLRRHSRSRVWAPSRRVLTRSLVVLFGLPGAFLLVLGAVELAAGPWSKVAGHLGFALAALAVAAVALRQRRPPSPG